MKQENDSHVQRIMSSISMSRSKSNRNNSSLPSLMSAKNHEKFWFNRKHDQMYDSTVTSNNHSLLRLPNLYGSTISGAQSILSNDVSQLAASSNAESQTILNPSLLVTMPEAEDVEELEKWTFEMKRNKRRRKLKGISSHIATNKQKGKTGGDKGETKLMMEMVDTIMASKFYDDHECIDYDEAGKKLKQKSYIGITKKKTRDSIDSTDSIDEEGKTPKDPHEKKYVYKTQPKHYESLNKGGEANHLSMNKELLREVLIKKMIDMLIVK